MAEKLSTVMLVFLALTLIAGTCTRSVIRFQLSHDCTCEMQKNHECAPHGP